MKETIEHIDKEKDKLLLRLEAKLPRKTKIEISRLLRELDIRRASLEQR